MSIKESNSYKTGEYIANNPNYHIEDAPWKAQQILKLLNNNHINVKTVCEVGCGSGEVLYQLKQLLNAEVEYTGYDISPVLTEMWKEREDKSLRFICEDFLSVDSSFELACYIDVVEHIEDYIGFLKGVKSRSEYKVFAFPLEISVAKAMFSKYYIHTYEKYGHIHFFNKEIVEFMLKYTGFDIIDSFLAPTAIALAGKGASVTKASRMLNIPRIIISKFNVELAQKLFGGYTLYALCK